MEFRCIYLTTHIDISTKCECVHAQKHTYAEADKERFQNRKTIKIKQQVL